MNCVLWQLLLLSLGIRALIALVSCWIVHLVLHVQVLIGSKDVSDIRHQFLTISDQWIWIVLLWRCRSALIRQNDRTHLEWRLAQVGNGDIRFKRSKLPGLILPDHELDVELARRQHEAGVVLHVFMTYLARLVHRQLHRLSRIADRMLKFVLDDSD